MGDQKKFIESEMDRFEKEISSIGPIAPGPSTSFIPAQLRKTGPNVPNSASNVSHHRPGLPHSVGTITSKPTPIIISGAPQVYNAGAKLMKPSTLLVSAAKSGQSHSAGNVSSSEINTSGVTKPGAASFSTNSSSSANSEPGPSSATSDVTSSSPLKIPMLGQEDKKKKKKKKKKSDDNDRKPRKALRSAGGQVWEDQTLQDWDPNDFRLFCGDLGNDVTDEVLTRVFGRYASFTKAKVVRDKRSNKTKGFGFVSFKDPNDFVRAIKELDGRYVGSRPIKLRKSNWRNRNLDQARKRDKERTQILSLVKK